tara:strand:- start:9493 stop:10149 length:657 start_codon:yes stop_codon:yes gene_type:complete
MSSLKKKLITSNDSYRDNINPIYENNTFKNTSLTKNPSKIKSRNLSKMNSIIDENIKQNEANMSSFRNQQTLNNTTSSKSNPLTYILNIIKKIFTIAFFIVILLLTIVFIFREKIIDFSKSLFNVIKEPSKSDKENNINELDNKIKNADQESDIIKGDDSDNSKSGFCYIGKINNKRTCANISDQRHCMSGEFFSTKKLCEVSGLNKDKDKNKNKNKK